MQTPPKPSSKADLSVARLPLLPWIYFQWIISISASSWPTPESWSTSGWVQKREEYKAEPHSGVVEQTQGDTSQGCTGQVLVFAWEWGIAGSQEKVQFSSNLPSKVHTVCSRTGSPELPQGHWNGFSGLSWKPFRPELWLTTPGPYLWGPSLFPWWPPTTTSLAWVDLSSCPTGRHPPPNAMLHHLPWSLLSQCPPTRLSIPVPTASHRPLHCPAFPLCLCPWLDCSLWPPSAGRGAWYIAQSPWVMTSVQDPCREAAGQESWPQPCTPLHPQPVRSFQAWLKGSFSPLHHCWCPQGETPAFLSSSVATHVYRNRVTSMQMASHSPVWDGSHDPLQGHPTSPYVLLWCWERGMFVKAPHHPSALRSHWGVEPESWPFHQEPICSGDQCAWPPEFHHSSELSRSASVSTLGGSVAVAAAAGWSWAPQAPVLKPGVCLPTYEWGPITVTPSQGIGRSLKCQISVHT